MTRRSVVILLLLASSCAFAQKPEDDPAKATAYQAREWLQGSDLRLVAWGAWRARVLHDEEAVPLLLTLASNWDVMSASSGDGVAPANAMHAVLDALIQEKVKVEANVLRAIAPDFPNEAVLLSSLLSAPERDPVLMEWFRWKRGDKVHSGYITRQGAAALLAIDTPQDFAAELLRNTTIWIDVSVTTNRIPGLGWGMGRVSCGGVVPYPKQENPWPATGRFVLHDTILHTTGREAAPDPIAIPGNDPILVHRVEMDHGEAQLCGQLEGLTNARRRNLIAQMVGLTSTEMNWKSYEVAHITFVSEQKYVQDLLDVAAAVRNKEVAATKMLVERGAMARKDLAESVPEILIHIDDMRNDKASALAAPSFPDDRIRYATPDESYMRYR